MAENLNLTAADVKVRLLTVSTFPAGFDVEAFADGDAISVTGVNAADMVKGVDGAAGYWYIPAVRELTMNLLPSSKSAKNLLLLAGAMETLKKPDLIQLVVTIPAMGISVTFVDGVLTSYPPLPGVQARLQNMSFSFKFREAQVVSI